MDIDLAGRVNNQLDHIKTKEVVGTVCDIDVEPDGMAFIRTSIEVSRIKEDADYEGGCSAACDIVVEASAGGTVRVRRVDR